jgi:hypothetical protein
MVFSSKNSSKALNEIVLSKPPTPMMQAVPPRRIVS